MNIGQYHASRLVIYGSAEGGENQLPSREIPKSEHHAVSLYKVVFVAMIGRGEFLVHCHSSEASVPEREISDFTDVVQLESMTLWHQVLEDTVCGIDKRPAVLQHLRMLGSPSRLPTIGESR